MAYALVGSIGTVASASASVSPTFGQATTAGNLLVAYVISQSSTNTTTAASGWSRAVVNSNSATYVFYKPNSSGAETAPTFTASSGVLVAALAEFSGGATASPLDQIGSVAASSSPGLAVCAATDAGTGELVVSSGLIGKSAANTATSADTYNNGATALGNVNNDATSTNLHYRFSYGITTGNAAADQVSHADSGMSVNAMYSSIASFKLAAAAAAAIPDVGMALTVT